MVYISIQRLGSISVPPSIFFLFITDLQGARMVVVFWWIVESTYNLKRRCNYRAIRLPVLLVHCRQGLQANERLRTHSNHHVYMCPQPWHLRHYRVLVALTHSLVGASDVASLLPPLTLFCSLKFTLCSVLSEPLSCNRRTTPSNLIHCIQGRMREQYLDRRPRLV